MCERGVAQRGVGELAHHGDLKLGHHFAAFEAQDGGAEELVGVGVHDGFHEAAGFVHFKRSMGDVIHGHAGDADGAILRAGLRFGEADAAKLRVDEDGVGHKSIGSGGAAVFQQVGAQDAEIVVGNVREGRAPLDVAERKDVFRGGFELFVNVDEAASIGRNRGGGKVQRVGVGDAARGDEQLGAFDFAGFSPDTELGGNAIAAAGDFFDRGVEMNLQAVFFQYRGNGIGDIFVFAAEELAGALEDGDATAQAVEELREFQADVAPAEHEKMRRNFAEFHDRSAVQEGNFREARNIGDRRAASGVDKETVSGEVEFAALLRTDDDGFGAGKRSHTIEEIEVFGLGDAALVAGAERNDRSRACVCARVPWRCVAS